jgi:hypothetical protein
VQHKVGISTGRKKARIGSAQEANMGADMYIHSIQKLAEKKYKKQFTYWVRKRDEYSRNYDKANADKAQEKVTQAYDKMYPDEGYFRDSYNATNLLWQLELSYWNGIDGYLDKKGYMQPDKIKEFLNQVVARELPEPEALELGDATIDDGENSRENWHKFFVEKRIHLIAFLGTALDRNEPIRCSF